MSKNESGKYHHGDLRRVLIAAALDLAAESNDWNFSLREVARRAGVSHNAPYNHFPHKRDLISAAALEGHELLRNELKSAIDATKTPRAAIFRMCSVYVRFGLRNAALYQLMFISSLSGPDWHPEAVVIAGEETRAMVEEVLRSGAARGFFSSTLARKANLQAASLVLWSAVHGLAMNLISGLISVEHDSIERVTERILRMVLDGVLGKNGVAV